MGSDELARFLAVCPEFHAVAMSQLEKLAHQCQIRVADSGDTLLYMSERLDHTWLLWRGLARIAVPSPQGKMVTIDVLRSGEFFGSAGCMQYGLSPCQATALVPSKVVGIPFKVYWGIVKEHSSAYQSTLHKLGKRLREAHLIRSLSAEKSQIRIFWLLVWLYDKVGNEIPLTRQIISEMAGVTPETVSRALSPIEKRNWIRSSQGRITVLSPEKLKKALSSPNSFSSSS